MNEQQTITARWLFPVASPPLERGTITIAGGDIVAVEPHGERTPDFDLGNIAILPGFVNAHTHLDLSGARGIVHPTPDFTQWLRQVIAFRRSRSAERVQADIAEGIAECLRFGTTLIGDIAASGASWDLFDGSRCKGQVFYEIIGLSDEGAAISWNKYLAWRKNLEKRWAGCRRALSPHAPYSVRRSLYSRASAHTSLIATHLAETPEEMELLQLRTGPFVAFLEDLGAWDPSGLVADPLEVIKLFPRGIFVHCNYLDPTMPFLSTQTVVVCPRTHAAFGHSHHPFPHFLKRGVRVALGTDSLASNPDLDILAEARFLRRHYPEVEPATLLRMLTLSGAEALGFGGITGSLAPAMSADLVVLPSPNEDRDDPHDLIFDSELPVWRVMFRGEWR
jgi:cytosine/adenosine deaminase-related metal-dependent hydrolase